MNIYMPVLPSNKAQLSPGSPSPFPLFRIVPLAQRNQPLGGPQRSLAWKGRAVSMKTGPGPPPYQDVPPDLLVSTSWTAGVTLL